MTTATDCRHRRRSHCLKANGGWGGGRQPLSPVVMAWFAGASPRQATHHHCLRDILVTVREDRGRSGTALSNNNPWRASHCLGRVVNDLATCWDPPPSRTQFLGPAADQDGQPPGIFRQKHSRSLPFHPSRRRRSQDRHKWCLRQRFPQLFSGKEKGNDFPQRNGR